MNEMTGKTSLILTRAAAAVMLFALLFGMMAVSRNRRVSALKTGNDVLLYEYSDDEMYIEEPPADEGYDIYAMLRDAEKKYAVDDGFIDFIAFNENINGDGYFIENCKAELSGSGYSDSMWEDLTGFTFSVLYDIYTDAAGGSELITVIGDIYETRKTVYAVYGGEKTADADAISDVDIFTSDEKDVGFYISGGTKTAVVKFGNEADVMASKSVSDVVIAVTDKTENIEALAKAGADLVVTSDGELTVEIINDGERKIYAVSGLSGRGYLTLSVTVGVDPVLRYYAAEGNEADIEYINSSSKTAYIDEKDRVKPKISK